MDPTRGDSRYNLNYSMSSIGLSLSDQADLYGNPAAAAALGGRPPSGGLMQTMGGGPGGIGLGSRSSGSLMSNSSQCQSLSNATSSGHGQQQQQQQQSRGIKRTNSDCYDEHLRVGSGSGLTAQMSGLDGCSPGGSGQQQQQQGGGSNVPDVVDDSYNSMQSKKSPPANGKKTKGRVKIKMEYIDNKLRRYTTFSKRKTGIMKKAYELSTLTGTQVMLLVASETGHVYTFATRKLQPMITSEAGKQLIQTCLNSPDPPSVGGGDQRMSATGFEETELSYNIADEDSKDDRSSSSSPNDSDESSDVEAPLLDAAPISNSCKIPVPNDADAAAVVPASTTSIPNGQSQHHENAMGSSNILQSANQSASGCGVLKTELNSSVIQGGSIGSVTNAFNNVMYPASALSGIPQEVLLQLIQSGHLQVHTEEDGSGHQYITIPLSVPPSTGGYRSTTGGIINEENSTAHSQSTTVCSTSKELNIKQEVID